MTTMIQTYTFILLCLIMNAFGFSMHSGSISTTPAFRVRSDTHLQMGLFDMFSPEAKAAREAAEAKKRAEQEEEIRLMMERRRNPEKMKEYKEDVKQRREAYANERDKFISEEEKKGAA